MPAAHAQSWGKLPDGRAVELWKLQLPDGSFAHLTTYGARLVALGVPDRVGQITDVVTGYDSLEGYLKGARFFGANAGPFANRIGGARFTIDGMEYRFTPNRNGNLLHSGDRGLDGVLWKAEAVPSGVAFSYTSPDGEFGFPGPVDYRIAYTFDSAHTLRIEFTAKAAKATHLNLAHHSYFNLAGHNAGSIADHTIEINANEFLETDAESIPTGNMLSVEGTPLDLRNPTRIGDRIDADFVPLRNCLGFDQCFVIATAEHAPSDLHFCCRVFEAQSGRVMETYSSLPGMQFYTANYPTPDVAGKDGARYAPRTSFCLEPQFFPNSPNLPQFPTTLVRPDKKYHEIVEYRFSVRPSAL